MRNDQGDGHVRPGCSLPPREPTNTAVYTLSTATAEPIRSSGRRGTDRGCGNPVSKKDQRKEYLAVDSLECRSCITVVEGPGRTSLRRQLKQRLRPKSYPGPRRRRARESAVSKAGGGTGRRWSVQRPVRSTQPCGPRQANSSHLGNMSLPCWSRHHWMHGRRTHSSSQTLGASSMLSSTHAQLF